MYVDSCESYFVTVILSTVGILGASGIIRQDTRLVFTQKISFFPGKIIYRCLCFGYKLSCHRSGASFIKQFWSYELCCMTKMMKLVPGDSMYCNELRFLGQTGPRQANLCLRAFRHDKFQLRMPRHSEGPGIWFSV